MSTVRMLGILQGERDDALRTCADLRAKLDAALARAEQAEQSANSAEFAALLRTVELAREEHRRCAIRRAVGITSSTCAMCDALAALDAMKEDRPEQGAKHG